MADATDSNAGEAVRAAARAHAIDHYLSAILAPRDVRDDLVVLAAFLGDVWRIPQIASEALIGEIRLQWWVDALSQSDDADRLTGNPVGDAVCALIRRRQLGPQDFIGIVEALRSELYSEPSADGISFETYLERTDGAAFEIASRILGVLSMETRSLCRHAGRAYGAVRVLKRLPYAASKGILLLPRDSMWPSPLGEAQDEIAREVTQAADVAREDRSRLRAKLSKPNRRQIAALLPVALVEPYLRVLQSPTHDPLRDIADIVPLTRVWRLWLAKVRARI